MGEPSRQADASTGDFVDDYKIYFEKQQAALCGVHAINTLLQSPLMSEIELADIAHQIDELEHNLMVQSGITNDYVNFINQESANVSSNGMFSIQVLSQALSIWGLTAIPLTSPEASTARNDPLTQQAYLCNLDEHWFTVRSIHGQWWDLNSLFTAPKPLSNFYVSAFLDSLREQGYTIFVIRGQLPPPGQPLDTGNGQGIWMLASDARRLTEESQEAKKKGLFHAAMSNIVDMASKAGTKMTLRSSLYQSNRHANANNDDGDDDDELLRALAESKSMMQNSNYNDGDSNGLLNHNSNGGGEDEDEDLAAAIAASLAEQPPNNTNNDTTTNNTNNDDTKTIAMGESILFPILSETEPTEESSQGIGIVQVCIRLPDGQRKSRRFLETETVGHVAAFANIAGGIDMNRNRLAASYPRRLLSDWSKSLIDAGIAEKQVMLFLEPIGRENRGASNEELDDAEYLGYIIAAVSLVVLAGLMSGLTLGLMSLDDVDLEVLKRSGNSRQRSYAQRILPVISNPHRLLVTLLVCNAIAAEALPIVIDRLADPITAIAVSVTVVLLFGEIIPQAACSTYGLEIGAISAPFVRILVFLTSPINIPIGWILDRVLGHRHTALFRRAELKALVDIHGEGQEFGGNLTADEVRIIKGALDLTHKTAKAAMTPLDLVFMLPLDAILDESTMTALLASGHSRIPVHRPGNKSAILGIVLVKELILVDISAKHRVSDMKIRSLPHLLAETPMYDMLKLFELGRSHMAVLTQPTQDALEARKSAEDALAIDVYSIDDELSVRGLDDDDDDTHQYVYRNDASPMNTTTIATPLLPPHSSPSRDESESDDDEIRPSASADIEAGSAPSMWELRKEQLKRTSTSLFTKAIKEQGAAATSQGNTDMAKRNSIGSSRAESSSSYSGSDRYEDKDDLLLTRGDVFSFDFQPHEVVAIGIITIEDVLEELLGSEIVDETDTYVDNLHNTRVNAAALTRSLPPHLRKAMATMHLTPRIGPAMQVYKMSGHPHTHTRHGADAKNTLGGMRSGLAGTSIATGLNPATTTATVTATNTANTIPSSTSTQQRLTTNIDAFDRLPRVLVPDNPRSKSVAARLDAPNVHRHALLSPQRNGGGTATNRRTMHFAQSVQDQLDTLQPLLAAQRERYSIATDNVDEIIITDHNGGGNSNDLRRENSI